MGDWLVFLYLGAVGLGLWIQYSIIKAAVKNGILAADAERAAEEARAVGRSQAV